MSQQPPSSDDQDSGEQSSGEQNSGEQNPALAAAVEESKLHDMGGGIGAASIRGSAAKDQGGAADDAAPQSGYAADLGPMAGRDEDQPSIAGSDESGYSAPVAPAVSAGAPSLYVDMDADESGRGADGDYEARLEQKRAGEF